MIAGVENPHHLQYAADLIRTLVIPIHHSPQLSIESAESLPTLYNLRQAALYAASLGHLEGPNLSLATIFKTQDCLYEMKAGETPPIEERLDLCSLAFISAALNHLGVSSLIQPQIEHGENHMSAAAFSLIKAKHLLYYVLDSQSPNGSATYLNLLVRDEIRRYRTRNLETAPETERKIYTPDSAWMEVAAHEADPYVTARFISYAYMNSARKELEVEPRNSQLLTPMICSLTRADGFINARLPFLIDLDCGPRSLSRTKT